MKNVALNTAGYLAPDEIVEFKQLCKKILNRDLTLEEAEDQGSRLIMLFEAMMKNQDSLKRK